MPSQMSWCEPSALAGDGLIVHRGVECMWLVSSYVIAGYARDLKGASFDAMAPRYDTVGVVTVRVEGI